LIARLAWLGLGALTLLVIAALPADAAGPWRAQILDAETGQPLDGVVVLAIWRTEPSGIRMHTGREFYDVDEVVSDADGRIVIPERSLMAWRRMSKISGPELVVFKPGYGIWEFRDVAAQRERLDPTSRREAIERAQKKFAREGVVIVLPALHTRKERLDFIRSLDCCPTPAERIPRYTEMLQTERRSLGFGPDR
jgi:hypothetical protein